MKSLITGGIMHTKAGGLGYTWAYTYRPYRAVHVFEPLITLQLERYKSHTVLKKNHVIL